MKPTIYTVEVILLEHTSAVKMNSCAIVFDCVLHVDDNGIAPASLDLRAWKLPIDYLCDPASIAICIDSFFRNLEVELAVVSKFVCEASCTGLLTVLVIPTGKSSS